MTRPELEEIRSYLQQQRAALFKEVETAETDLQFISEDREPEADERAQREKAAGVFARLDLRGKHEIELIDQALHRLADGRYGTCLECGDEIPHPRLQALPATPYCVDCALQREADQRQTAPA